MSRGPIPTAADRAFRCLSCGAPSGATLIERIPYSEIWDRLRTEWEASFSEDVMRRHTPCGETALLECPRCGAQFFDPPAAGDSDFYRELGESPRYYASWKWEFDWVKERLSPGIAVLDVGCGSGEFLAGIAPTVGRVVGLEWSSSASSRARERGLEVREGDLAACAGEFAHAFDAVCAFHILEHLPDPAGFLEFLRRCLRPGGALYVSVPNRMRSGRAQLEPLDCPPHHLTRWSPAALNLLVRRSGFLPTEVATEPVELSIPRDLLRKRIQGIVGKVPAVGGLLETWLPRAAWRIVFFPQLLSLYRRYGVLERAGFFGLSVVVRCVEAPS